MSFFWLPGEKMLGLTYLGAMKGQNAFDLLALPPRHREMVESLMT